MSDWEASAVRPLALEAFGERYRRYRLCDPAAEDAMARSLQRYGQIAPVVVCVHDGSVEVVDGFKRLAEQKEVKHIPSLLDGLLSQPGLMSDYVHPNDAGYAKIAERLEKELRPLLPQLLGK